MLPQITTTVPLPSRDEVFDRLLAIEGEANMLRRLLRLMAKTTVIPAAGEGKLIVHDVLTTHATPTTGTFNK